MGDRSKCKQFITHSERVGLQLPSTTSFLQQKLEISCSRVRYLRCSHFFLNTFVEIFLFIYLFEASKSILLLFYYFHTILLLFFCPQPFANARYDAYFNNSQDAYKSTIRHILPQCSCSLLIIQDNKKKTQKLQTITPCYYNFHFSSFSCIFLTHLRAQVEINNNLTTLKIFIT